MIKWNFFKKLIPENKVFTTNETKKILIKEDETHKNNKPLAEYKETLYTNTKSSKKTNSTSSSKNNISWRDVNSIENKIDKLHTTKAQKPKTEIDKTVDKVITKGKKK